MIEIHHSRAGKHATCYEKGNIISLLERTLIELATLNYGAFLADARSWGWKYDNLGEPLLFKSERQVSGLFFSALSKSSPFILTEKPVSRTNMEAEEDQDAITTSSGREDYYVWYENRAVSIELKRNKARSTEINEEIKNKWRSVCKQAEQNLSDMRANPRFHRYPAAIGILALPRISNRTHETLDELEVVKERSKHADSVKILKPDFIASYLLPPQQWSSNGDNERTYCHPYIIYAAKIFA